MNQVYGRNRASRLFTAMANETLEYFEQAHAVFEKTRSD